MLIPLFALIAALAAAVYIYFAGFVFWKVLLLFVGVYILAHVVYIGTLGLMSLFVDDTKPIKKQRAVFRHGCAGVAELAVSYCFVRPHITGEELLPKDGRFLFVSNHQSQLDPLVVIHKLRKYNISFISKQSNMDLPVFGKIAYGAGYLPIDRDNNREALKTILRAEEYVRSDFCSFGVYPEGTRNRTDELLPFRAGVFKLAQKTKIPVVIASSYGARNIFGNIIKGGTDIYLDILEVIPAEKVASMSTTEVSEYTRNVIAGHLAEVRNNG